MTAKVRKVPNVTVPTNWVDTPVSISRSPRSIAPRSANTSRPSTPQIVVGRISPSLHAKNAPSFESLTLFSQLHHHVNLTWHMLSHCDQMSQLSNFVRFLANREHGYVISQDRNCSYTKYPISAREVYLSLPNMNDKSPLSIVHQQTWSTFCAISLCHSLHRRVMRVVKMHSPQCRMSYALGPSLELDTQPGGGMLVTLSCIVVVESDCTEKDAMHIEKD